MEHDLYHETKVLARAEILAALTKILLSFKVEYREQELDIWMDDICEECKYDPVEFIVDALNLYRVQVEGYRNWNHYEFVKILQGKRLDLAKAREQREKSYKIDDQASINEIHKAYAKGMRKAHEEREAMEREQENERKNHTANVRKQAEKYLKEKAMDEEKHTEEDKFECPYCMQKEAVVTETLQGHGMNGEEIDLERIECLNCGAHGYE